MNGWTVETGVMRMNNITPSSKKKTSISVREMRQILGLNKVESYWLVHQNRFRTIVAAGRMRIMLDSFEEWYAGQFHYKKVNGEAPGSKWEKTTMSIREAAALLGLQEATLYDLLKKKCHPDRFSTQPELVEKATEIFALIVKNKYNHQALLELKERAEKELNIHF